MTRFSYSSILFLSRMDGERCPAFSLVVIVWGVGAPASAGLGTDVAQPPYGVALGNITAPRQPTLPRNV